MPDKNSILVYGINELASAVARLLLLSGHAVAIRAAEPRGALRRKMSFADAWYDGIATLEEVEARRASQDADLLIGLRSGMYIPLLADPAVEAVTRWPWDIVVDARQKPAGATRRLDSYAELTIVLGLGAVAGRDCDLVIETGGPDPGAVLREGAATGGPSERERGTHLTFAPRTGMFRACKAIGETVTTGEVMAIVDTLPVLAPMSGRLCGLLRSPSPVHAGDAVAEIAESLAAPTSGVAPADQALARAVDFAIELERHDLPASLFVRD